MADRTVGQRVSRWLVCSQGNYPSIHPSILTLSSLSTSLFPPNLSSHLLLLLHPGKVNFDWCNHQRAYQYYSESAVKAQGFVAYPCPEKDSFAAVSVSPFVSVTI